MNDDTLTIELGFHVGCFHCDASVATLSLSRAESQWRVRLDSANDTHVWMVVSGQHDRDDALRRLIDHAKSRYSRPPADLEQQVRDFIAQVHAPTVTLHTAADLTALQKLATIRALIDGTAIRWTVCDCEDGDHPQSYGDQPGEDGRAIADIVDGRTLIGSIIVLPASVLSVDEEGDDR